MAMEVRLLRREYKKASGSLTFPEILEHILSIEISGSNLLVEA